MIPVIVLREACKAAASFTAALWTINFEVFQEKNRYPFNVNICNGNGVMAVKMARLIFGIDCYIFMM